MSTIFAQFLQTLLGAVFVFCCASSHASLYSERSVFSLQISSVALECHFFVWGEVATAKYKQETNKQENRKQTGKQETNKQENRKQNKIRLWTGVWCHGEIYWKYHSIPSRKSYSSNCTADKANTNMLKKKIQSPHINRNSLIKLRNRETIHCIVV